MPCQTYDYTGEDENNKNTLRVLWCNYSRWGAQANHYDLLYPIVEEEKKRNTFEQTFRQQEGEDDCA
eukprot:6159946-Heterocapsa_arctica.AAC.1